MTNMSGCKNTRLSKVAYFLLSQYAEQPNNRQVWLKEETCIEQFVSVPFPASCRPRMVSTVLSNWGAGNGSVCEIQKDVVLAGTLKYFGNQFCSNDLGWAELIEYNVVAV
mmetsp:Transcript_22323/g.62015  ORF Transcript_22323/g.62015 Transcript_22323/m.62015 type:complete len:110 (+) Transcript_22323:878-1207(+)